MRLLELPVPDFVRVLDIDLQRRIEPLFDHLGEVADELVICQVRHAEPRVDLLPVAQLDHPFQRHAAFREGRMLQRRPLAPSADLRTVRVHPIHEAKTGEAFPPLEEGRMERVLFPRLLEAGHDDVDVADRVGRIRLVDLEREAALARIHVDQNTARRSFFDLRVLAEVDSAFALVEHRIDARRIVAATDRAEHGLGVAARFQPLHPAEFVDRQLRPLAPACAFLLTDPRPGRAERIDEWQFGHPIRRPGEVDAEPRFRVGRRSWTRVDSENEQADGKQQSFHGVHSLRESMFQVNSTGNRKRRRMKPKTIRCLF